MIQLSIIIDMLMFCELTFRFICFGLEYQIDLILEIGYSF